MSNYLWYVVSFILANSWDKRKAKKKKAFMNLVFVDIMFAFIMRICLSIIVEIRISSMFNDTAWRPKNLILLPFQKLYLIVLNFLLHLHVISNKCPSTVFVSVLIIIRYMLIHFFFKNKWYTIPEVVNTTISIICHVYCRRNLPENQHWSLTLNQQHFKIRLASCW